MATRSRKISAPLTFDLPLSLIAKIESCRKGHGFRTASEVVRAVREEMARTVEDFLARRMRLLLLDAQAAIQAAPKVAEWMASELKRNVEWQPLQIAAFTELARGYSVQGLSNPSLQADLH